MGQITLLVEECGCYVQQDSYQEEKVRIIYCPKHESAPAMYEALEAISAQFRQPHIREQSITYTRVGVALSQKIKAGEKALAKAEGK